MKNLKPAINLLLEIKKNLSFLDRVKFNNIKNFRSKKKLSIDPVTHIDLKVEKLIRAKISKKFPSHSIMGEEFKEKKRKSNFKWVIDPIDGTKNMIMGLPTWSNLIGLFEKNTSVISFANFPVLNKFYFAFQKKSFVLEKNRKKIILSNKRADYKTARVAVNTFRTIKDRKIFNLFKNYKGIFKITGSDAYNFCLVAEGKIDVLIEKGLKQVDILPLISIIKNSGAIITDWNGKQKYNKGEVLVAANKKLHKYFLKKVS
tara:strand:+ start:92 stop:868 length:777 start_codon:yes stop_codon:yes gene_type:complete